VSAHPVNDELLKALQDLLYAIATADEAAVGTLFCEEGTMHFPGGNHRLHVGRAAVVERLGKLFGELRQRLPGPTYVRFKLEEFACLPLDARHAAVYASLTVDGRHGRRTLIYRRERAGWRILHFHASNEGTLRGPETA
jgi:hypothetical protein